MANEYEAGRHEGVRRALEAARAVLGATAEQKRELDAAAVVPEAEFQYCSGLYHGAARVVRRLDELAEDLRVHEAARERGESQEHADERRATGPVDR